MRRTIVVIPHPTTIQSCPKDTRTRRTTTTRCRPPSWPDASEDRPPKHNRHRWPRVVVSRTKMFAIQRPWERITIFSSLLRCRPKRTSPPFRETTHATSHACRRYHHSNRSIHSRRPWHLPSRNGGKTNKKSLLMKIRMTTTKSHRHKRLPAPLLPGRWSTADGKDPPSPADTPLSERDCALRWDPGLDSVS
jgi:hypothetical protein